MSWLKIVEINSEQYIKNLNTALIKAKKENILKTDIVTVNKALPTIKISGGRRTFYECKLSDGTIENRRIEYIIAKLIGAKYLEKRTNNRNTTDILFYDSFGNVFRQSRFDQLENSAGFRRFNNVTSKNAISFTIKPKDLEKQLKKQNYKCRFTGLPLSFASHKNPGSVKASIDRIDSSKGYIKGNIQWVAAITNLMKQSLSDAEFISWCKLISQHNK